MKLLLVIADKKIITRTIKNLSLKLIAKSMNKKHKEVVPEVKLSLKKA